MRIDEGPLTAPGEPAAVVPRVHHAPHPPWDRPGLVRGGEDRAVLPADRAAPSTHRTRAAARSPAPASDPPSSSQTPSGSVVGEHVLVDVHHDLVSVTHRWRAAGPIARNDSAIRCSASTFVALGSLWTGPAGPPLAEHTSAHSCTRAPSRAVEHDRADLRRHPGVDDHRPVLLPRRAQVLLRHLAVRRPRPPASDGEHTSVRRTMRSTCDAVACCASITRSLLVHRRGNPSQRPHLRVAHTAQWRTPR